MRGKSGEMISVCLPEDGQDGWENNFLTVTCENLKRADERIPILLDLPFKHKGFHCAPLLGPISRRHSSKTVRNIESEINSSKIPRPLNPG